MWSPKTLVGAYEIVRVIGYGGMSVVYEARHRKLDGRVAIKALRAETSLLPQAAAQIVGEGRALAKIKHPHVLSVSDVVVHDNALALVMELIDGRSLKQHLTESPPMTVVAALDLMLPVIAGMSAAHGIGVIHRDLKPGNIMLERRDDGVVRPVVLDFGIATLGEVDVAGAQPDELVGTPAYFSPEHLRGSGAIVPASDQFAIGAMLYECLTGQRAFPNEWPAVGIAIAEGRFTPPREHRPELPAALDAVVRRALAHDPAARFPSLQALGKALLPFASARAALTLRSAFVPDDERTDILPVMPSRPSQPPAPEPASDTPATSLTPASGPVARRALASRGQRVLGVLGVAAALLVLAMMRCRGARETFIAAADVTPGDAVLRVDGAVVGRGRFARRYAADGVAHTLTAEAPGYEPYDTTFVNVGPESPITLRAVRATVTAPVDTTETAVVRAPARVEAPAAQEPVAQEPQPVAPRRRRPRGVRGAPDSEGQTLQRGTNNAPIMKGCGEHGA